jgi:hypothetical protein
MIGAAAQSYRATPLGALRHTDGQNGKTQKGREVVAVDPGPGNPPVGTDRERLETFYLVLPRALRVDSPTVRRPELEAANRSPPGQRA